MSILRGYMILKKPTWDPYDDWRPANVNWIRAKLSKEDLKRFQERSNRKGMLQTLGFLLILFLTASFSYYAFANHSWILLAVGLYFHGMAYGHFGDGIHELIHNTVFDSKFLNKTVTLLFGLLYWPYNPYFYRISHVHYHHRYTLFQNSDGEDVPNYVELNLKTLLSLFLNVLHFRSFFQCTARLLTLKPISKGWRMRGYRLDQWEKFILEKASDKERKEIHQFTAISLAFHVIFIAASVWSGNWFLVVLITLAPFYGPGIHGFLCGIHQHANCEANHADFRRSCGDATLDPISSILYWHMEYHIEHHMMASIPCYNLKKFSMFISDQMPPKEHAIPRLMRLAKQSPALFGSREQWRENFGRFKGF